MVTVVAVVALAAIVAAGAFDGASTHAAGNGVSSSGARAKNGTAVSAYLLLVLVALLVLGLMWCWRR